MKITVFTDGLKGRGKWNGKLQMYEHKELAKKRKTANR